jgi:hypothetical protein
LSNYLTYAITFSNFVLLVAVWAHVSGLEFPLLAVAVFICFSSIGIVIGNLHRRWQQSTDVLVGYQAMIDEIVARVLAGLLKEQEAKRPEVSELLSRPQTPRSSQGTP